MNLNRIRTGLVTIGCAALMLAALPPDSAEKTQSPNTLTADSEGALAPTATTTSPAPATDVFPGASTDGFFYYPDSTTYALPHAEGYDIFGFPITTSTLYRKIVVETESMVNFAGRLLERGTRRPMSDTMVILMENEESALTDSEGYFEFYDVPEGIYTVIVATIGFKKYQTKEVIEFNSRTDVIYYIEPQFASNYEIVVSEKREKKEVSKTTIKRQEILTVPGAGGDAVKAVQALPGINLVNEASGDLLVRGSSPGSNLYFYNRLIVPYLNHFGGIRSVFNSELIEKVDFIAGGHGVQYALAQGGSGGVLDIYTRDGRSDRIGGFIDVNSLMTEGMIEGPIAQKETTFAISGRRSYLDLTLPYLGLSAREASIDVFPTFTDFQLQLAHKPNDTDRYAFYTYGARDEMAATITEENPDEPTFVGGFSFSNSFIAGGANIDLEMADGMRNYSAPFYDYQLVRTELGSDYYLNIEAHTIGLRQLFEFDLHEMFQLNVGGHAGLIYYDVGTKIIRPPTEGDVYTDFSNEETIEFSRQDSYTEFGVFIEGEFRPTEDVEIVGGLRGDYSSVNFEKLVSPRLSARWQIVDITAIKGAWGMYYEFPGLAEASEEFGDSNLKASLTYHYIIGLEQKIYEGLSLELQGYYKHLTGLVSPTGELDPYLDNRGEGFSYGAEIFLRQSLVDRFYGWISYAYNTSRRNYGGAEYKLFEWDQPHVVNIVASYLFTDWLQFGLKWRYASGQPSTPFNGSIYIADNNTYIPIPGELNSKRLPDYHRLDLRWDFKQVFDTWTLTIYLELINAYGLLVKDNNVVGEAYNYDYSQSQYSSIFPMMPALGLKAAF